MPSVGRVVHVLKSWPVLYQAIARGEKTFEVRYNDRQYQKGDIVLLREYDPSPDYEGDEQDRYTGSEMQFEIGFCLHGPEWGVDPAYVVFSLLAARPDSEVFKDVASQG
jgi:uncharacterized protein DUF3850